MYLVPVFTQPSVSEAPSRRKGKHNDTIAVSKNCYKTKSYTISIQINMSCGNANAYEFLCDILGFRKKEK